MAQLLKNIYGQHKVLHNLLQVYLNKNLPHGLLFIGPSGIGKQKSAWALAQVLLCKKSSSACGECLSCQKVIEQKSEFILFVRPEGLQIKAEAVRHIRDFLSLQSFAPARIIIIESAHQMNRFATGSLLKILEEPPKNVFFILITSQPSMLAKTILSRLQSIRFTPLQKEDVLKIKPNSEEWIIRACQGRIDLLEELKEKKELRNQAFDVLNKMITPEGEIHSFNELKDLVQDRTQALFVCLCYQQMFRDALLSQIEMSDLIHVDHQQLVNVLKKLPKNTILYLFAQAIQMETDLKNYGATVLIFDYFLLTLRDTVQQLSNNYKGTL